MYHQVCLSRFSSGDRLLWPMAVLKAVLQEEEAVRSHGVFADCTRRSAPACRGSNGLGALAHDAGVSQRFSSCNTQPANYLGDGSRLAPVFWVQVKSIVKNCSPLPVSKYDGITYGMTRWSGNTVPISIAVFLKVELLSSVLSICW